jgi:hypothetical protein
MSDAEALENIIDRIGLSKALELIEGICRDKADHVRSNWQDDELADTWEQGADALAHALRGTVLGDL